MRDVSDLARYHECAEVLDAVDGKTLECLCKLAVQNLQEDGNIPSILIHHASVSRGDTWFGYLNKNERDVDLWSKLLKIIEFANERIDTWEWETREVTVLIENGLKLMKEEKSLTRKPEIWGKLAGYNKFILSFLG